jgi:phosphohistidine phosphatase SixA
MAESQAYLEGLRTLPDNIERVMVVGHNPGLEGTVANSKWPGRIPAHCCHRHIALRSITGMN